MTLIGRVMILRISPTSIQIRQVASHKSANSHPRKDLIDISRDKEAVDAMIKSSEPPSPVR